MFVMGAIYRVGWGVDEGSEQATRWFYLAARQGDDSSAFYLLQLFLNLRSMEEDIIEDVNR